MLVETAVTTIMMIIVVLAVVVVVMVVWTNCSGVDINEPHHLQVPGLIVT